MPTLKVTGRSFRYRGDRYQHGDTFEAEDGVLGRHPNTLERVESDGSDGSDSADGSDEVEDGTDDVDIDPHPSDLKVDQLKERLQDVEEVELVEAILKLEKESDDRTTAKNAINSRLNELEE